MEAQTFFDKALRHHQAAQWDRAAEFYRRAITSRPDFIEALYNLGTLLQNQGRRDEAAACYRKVLALKPDYVLAHNNLGTAAQDAGDFAQAEQHYRRALALQPAYAQAHNNLGTALKHLGRFQDAIAAHQQALALGRDRAKAWYGLSGCRRFTKADLPAIAAMTTLLKDAQGEDRALLHFALGKVFDDLGDYQTAITHYDNANALEPHGFDAARLAALTDWLITSFPATPPSAAASDSHRPVFIVGMPRSGTTLVEQILASHPQIAGGGEQDFWLQRSAALAEDGTADGKAVADYLALLHDIAPDAARVTDKMPYNFMFLGLLHRLFPQARIIHCRRDPIDTALSIYFSRFNPLHSFAASRQNIVAYFSHYRRLMQHWRTTLPPDRLLEIDYEDLIAEPEATSRVLVSFCGLEWNEACLDFHTTDRPIATASAWQARQPLYTHALERWRSYEPWLGELRQL